MTWRATWKRHIGFHGLNVFHFWDIIHLHIEAKFHFSTSSRFLCNNYSLDEWKTPSCLGHSGGCSHYPWAPWDHEITYEMGIPQPKKQPEKTPRSFIPRRPQVQLAIPTDDPRSWSKLHFFQGFCGQTSGKSTPPSSKSPENWWVHIFVFLEHTWFSGFLLFAQMHLKQLFVTRGGETLGTISDVKLEDGTHGGLGGCQNPGNSG